jgi:hypothetical protein
LGFTAKILQRKILAKWRLILAPFRTAETKIAQDFLHAIEIMNVIYFDFLAKKK